VNLLLSPSRSSVALSGSDECRDVTAASSSAGGVTAIKS
jgi:hypothetical protein